MEVRRDKIRQIMQIPDGPKAYVNNSNC